MADFSISMVAVLPLLLLVRGANAALIYPTSQEFNNQTRFFIQTPGLLQRLVDADKSRSFTTNSAYHQLQAGESAGYYGVSVTMDAYALSLSNDQYSSAAVQISSGRDGQADWNFIKIGWEIYPLQYGGDSRTHLGAIWTTDGLQQTCCANTECGFQPDAGATLVLGDIIEPVSQANGIKQTLTIKLLKDGASGDWLVHCGLNQHDPRLISRYPKSLFTGGLAERATNIHIGGVVATRNRDLVPMGSGYLPTNETMAASFSNIQIVDQNGHASLLSHNSSRHMSQPDTYSVSSVINGKFFYGGPYQSTT